ncbi:MAG TPA: hypothetical protein VJ464_00765 [Blastocatellia bacterium]|nr:hypothetical protein [Blastocatellia bacterium]
MSSLQRYFLSPQAPPTAAGFIDDSFTVVDLRRARHGFALSASAVSQLPPDVMKPSFDELNILNIAELVEIIKETAEAAGLMRKKRWSVALPDSTARSFVVPLESKPGSRAELNEVLAWKIERLVAAPATELRISRQRISPLAGQERYVLTVAREEVIAQYEEIFGQLRWTAGLMLPRHLGEAQWLAWDKAPGDKLLVSANRQGFTSLVMRNGEPLLVRSYQCEPEATADELHRFALYYRDRLATNAGPLSAMLVLGQIDLDEAQRAVSDATESEPRPLRATEFGFDMNTDAIRFEHLAGAAGLATIAWQ